MGLAAPRKKTKISHDPNNTNWSRSTSGFGHKILSSQGWTPGSFLGARNAAHADMFTAASASHIRVIVKDDTLGLGARSKRDPLDEPTGLDAFKGLLGRLNGKSDVELQADQRKRDDVKLARYAATKWQAVRFISGGLLAQEKDNEATSISKETQNLPADAQAEERKETVSTNGDHVNECVNNKAPAIDHSEVSGLRERKHKNNKGRKSAKEKREKLEKRQKKERSEKKEKTGRKRKHTDNQEGTDSSPSQEQSFELDISTSNEQDQPSSDAGPSVKERRPLGRHMIRGRHIAQKRKALMDEKSLNEIFMVKS
ncbi:hypothetical protein ASPVEDRAFT_86710 [Aspergillus versicolor CBS 583.65]|uniref:Protein PXR1 n=1 Tax=Aspergillus versicolor CBS 583.65 TaxID=1036611 RepID=A0A1L9PV06_ASPVE|nr:uncharacterized protein ASPVEDRAFT_86710 [Aspergillus versicolor CBS 583.65]OJJ05357.1 hypothetical protein ASPVEDRAFT_86710 [Aspergillus versicolor CBS 583.65]